ncbi:MAG: Hpt domain-containing protein, partial [Mangrovicoccus sp.]
LHSIDEVSLTELEESSGADRLPGLIGAFIRDTDTAIAVLSATDIENHADADVMSVIHRLSGSAALFGAMELHRECYLLEERGKTGSMREVYERLPDLARIWAGIRPYFITRKEMSAEDAYASVGSASSA